MRGGNRPSVGAAQHMKEAANWGGLIGITQSRTHCDNATARDILGAPCQFDAYKQFVPNNANQRALEMSNNSNFSWRSRLRPIELGYVCGIAATNQLTYFSAAVVHEIYSYPPSGVTEFLLWVEESIAYWLQTMVVGFFVYLAYTVLFALVMALPAAVAISYMEIHKIRHFGRIVLALYCFGPLPARCIILAPCFWSQCSIRKVRIGYRCWGGETAI
jgi:hypothetical protein